VVDGGLIGNVYALDSVHATGWSTVQARALAEVREQLASVVSSGGEKPVGDRRRCHRGAVPWEL
jgi:hypothetical protein